MSAEAESQQTLKSEFDKIKLKIKASRVDHFTTIQDLKEIKASSCGLYLLALTTQSRITVISLESNSKVQELCPDIQVKSFCEVSGTLYVFGKGLKKCEHYLINPNFEVLSTEDIISIAIASQKVFYISNRTIKKLGTLSETNSSATVLAANGQIVVAAQKTIAIIYNHELRSLTQIKLKESYNRLILLESDVLIAGGDKKTMQIYDYGKKSMYNYKVLNNKVIASFVVSEEMNLMASIDTDISFLNLETYKDEGKLKLGDEKKKYLNAVRSICFTHGGKSVYFSLGPMIFKLIIVESYKFSEIVKFQSDIKEISYNGKVVVKSEETVLFDLETRTQETQAIGDCIHTKQGMFAFTEEKVFKDGTEVHSLAHESTITAIYEVQDFIVTQGEDFTVKILAANGSCFTFLRKELTEFMGSAGEYFFFKSFTIKETGAEPLTQHHLLPGIEDRRGSNSFLTSFKEEPDIKHISREFLSKSTQKVEAWGGINWSVLCSSREISGNLLLFNNSPKVASFKDWILNIYHSIDSNSYSRIPCNELIGEPIYYTLSNDDMYFFVATKSYLGICSIFEQKYLGSIYYGTIDHILVLEKFILITCENKLHIYPNPVDKNAELSLLAPENFTLKHWIDINVLLDSANLGKYNSYLNSVIILPVCTNLLHFFTHLSSHEGIKKALKEGCTYLKSVRFSPLQIIFMQKTSNLIDYFLKSLPRYLETDENVLYRIEDDLIQLNRLQASKLLILYNSILVDPQQRLPKFGTPSFKSLKTKLSDSRIIDPNNYIIQSTDTGSGVNFSNSLPLSFKISAMRLPLKFGTQESLDFLESLKTSQDQDLLITPIIQSILTSKWSIVWYWTLIQCILILMILIILCLYIFFNENSSYLFTCIQILNLLNLFLETLKMSIGFRKYIWNFLNVMDFLRICCILILCLDLKKDYQRLFLTIIVMFTWIKAIFYFRIFDKTRYFIYIVSCCAKDILPFLVILFYLNFTFALTFYKLDQLKEHPDFSGFTDAWIHSYTLNFNSFHISVYKDYKEWVVFIIATVTNPLILMNMIIALLGNTYTMLKDQAGTADMKELAGMIIEYESMLFWRRSNQSKLYVQICSSIKISVEEPDNVKSKVKEISTCVNETNQGLESFSIHSQESAQAIDSILSKVTSEFSIELEKLESNLRTDYQLLLKRIL